MYVRIDLSWISCIHGTSGSRGERAGGCTRQRVTMRLERGVPLRGCGNTEVLTSFPSPTQPHIPPLLEILHDRTMQATSSSSPSCSTPALATTGSTPSQARATLLRAPRALGWPVSTWFVFWGPCRVDGMLFLSFSLQARLISADRVR